MLFNIPTYSCAAGKIQKKVKSTDCKIISLKVGRMIVYNFHGIYLDNAGEYVLKILQQRSRFICDKRDSKA